MPRRFSIGTAMILTAVFAVMLSILKTFDAPPVVFGFMSVFVVAIAVCQALLFKGKNPRKASIIVGVAMGILLFILLFAFQAWAVHYRGWRVEPREYLMIAAVGGIGIIVCTAVGYVAGWFIAAVFLVRKEPDNAPPPHEDTTRGRGDRLKELKDDDGQQP
jgi:uncharacterized protein YhhL (DUF1145 family)